MEEGGRAPTTHILLPPACFARACSCLFQGAARGTAAPAFCEPAISCWAAARGGACARGMQACRMRARGVLPHPSSLLKLPTFMMTGTLRRPRPAAALGRAWLRSRLSLSLLHTGCSPTNLVCNQTPGIRRSLAAPSSRCFYRRRATCCRLQAPAGSGQVPKQVRRYKAEIAVLWRSPPWGRQRGSLGAGACPSLHVPPGLATRGMAVAYPAKCGLSRLTCGSPCSRLQPPWHTHSVAHAAQHRYLGLMTSSIAQPPLSWLPAGTGPVRPRFFFGPPGAWLH
jgi:hypothetical protein